MGSELGEYTGLGLDLKWLLAVLSSTLIWGCGHVLSSDLWPNLWFWGTKD